MDTVLQVRKAPGQFACLVNLMWLLCFVLAVVNTVSNFLLRVWKRSCHTPVVGRRSLLSCCCISIV